MGESSTESEPGAPGPSSFDRSLPIGQPGPDQETTRYLSAATQLDLRYARRVAGGIIGETFRAVAPAAGADVVIVTQWALAALRRRAYRDAVLTGLLILGVGIALAAWTWLPIAAMAALAILVVACERWIRDERVIARSMLRGRFHTHNAPSPLSPRVKKRLNEVQKQQNGNLVVFRGSSAFVGSGYSVVHDRILIDAALGRRKNGQRQPPVPFSNSELYDALEEALKSIGFADLRVSRRLYVNGEHVAAYSRLLPKEPGPPIADAPADYLYGGCVNPTPEARTYLCAEIGGWKGQLVVSLFTRAVQAHGSLQVEWEFYALPPLHDSLLEIDHRYEWRRIRQFADAMAIGIAQFIPGLIWAPVSFTRYAVVPLTGRIRARKQRYEIRHGYVFNYGSPPSIREDAVSDGWFPNYFLEQDEWTFILLAEHTMIRALGRFLREHKIDMRQFNSQEQKFIKKVQSKYNIDKIDAGSVAVGTKAHVDLNKKPGSSGS
jgi:hypothetical protein